VEEYKNKVRNLVREVCNLISTSVADIIIPGPCCQLDAYPLGRLSNQNKSTLLLY